MDVKYKPVAFPNGSAKKAVKPAAAAMAPQRPSSQVVTYQDCLRNHAANLGAHAVDGCREFLPTPENNPADPWSLKCAACGCHRNFHRRVLVEDSPPPLPPQRRGEEETPVERLPGVDSDSDSDGSGSGYDDERSMSPPPLPQHQQPPPPVAHNPAPVAQQPPAPPGAYFSPALAPAPHMLLSLNSSAPGAAQQRLPVSPVAAAQMVPAGPGPAQHLGVGAMMPAQRKRFRTKFTPEQKKRMQELSERLGWRLQKRDEAVVDERCRDIGVSKGVFKVWMHNNKHNYLGGHSARRSASASSAAATPTTASEADATAAAPPPPFSPSAGPAATGFNMNGTGGHPVNGGASSSQSA